MGVHGGADGTTLLGAATGAPFAVCGATVRACLLTVPLTFCSAAPPAVSGTVFSGRSPMFSVAGAVPVLVTVTGAVVAACQLTVLVMFAGVIFSRPAFNAALAVVAKL